MLNQNICFFFLKIFAISNFKTNHNSLKFKSLILGYKKTIYCLINKINIKQPYQQNQFKALILILSGIILYPNY
jgi:hypothetical protein